MRDSDKSSLIVSSEYQNKRGALKVELRDFAAFLKCDVYAKFVYWALLV
jgi:hypothetical protein